ncbi:MAG: TolC family protein [Verrucomicrobia bacterium]|nr:TolC family protein [Verrucomicrobiota bacterium]
MNNKVFQSTTFVLCLFGTGCVGLRTPGEIDAREKAQMILRKYRPDNAAPGLPELKSGGSPDTYIRYAIYKHPRVEAAYYEWLASMENITRERSLPDPVLTFEMDIGEMIMAVMPGLMMNFPGPGKLRAAAEVATEEGNMKYFQFEAAVLQVAYGFKKAWYELQLVDERVRVTAEMVTLLEDLEKLAQSLAEVGKGSLQDLLRTQMEKERLQTELASLRDSRQWFMTQYKSSLGLGADDAAPPLPLGFDSSPLSLSGDQILAKALGGNPRLRAMEADVRRAEAAIVQAQRTRIPDFSLGAMADVKASPVMLRPTAAMTLPIWRDKIAAVVEGARDQESASKARLSDERLALTVEVATKSYTYRESTRLLALLESSLLPKARQSLEVARSGYSAGTTNFINLIDAERTLLEFRLAEVEARIKRELALADLSLQVMGVPPTGAPVLESSVR